MTRFFCFPIVLLLNVFIFLCVATVAADNPKDRNGAFAKITVDPATVSLIGPNARHSLLLHGETVDGQLVDLTRAATYESKTPSVFTVTPIGLVLSVADGQGTLEISVAGRKLTAAVVVRDSGSNKKFNFENDIIPILTRFGCNNSGCHGKAEGQNGFKLSVFGFDPVADFVALTKEGRGRRVNPAVPLRSLLLTKSSGGSPHGGGVPIRKGSGDYRILRDWILAGAPYGDETDPTAVSISVTPHERQLSMKSRQQLRVVATFSDGRRADVTGHAKFQSNNEGLGKVDEFGLVTIGESPGEVAVMAGYMGSVDVFRAMIASDKRIENYPKLPENNFIDGLVHAKLKKLHILPSGPGTDAEFMRRVFLDIIGTLPTPAEARPFLSDKRPDRRARLVDQLLKRPEYADYWALKWADVLRVNRLKLGHKRAYAYYKWIRDSFAANKPLDQFTRDLIAAEGPLSEVPAGQFYRVVGDAGARASTVSQIFLGIRIECAQCHHHPYDRWSQTDYFGMHAFFTQVAFKKAPRGDAIVDTGNGKSVHPRTKQQVFAHPLATPNPDKSPEGDRRKILAAWMTAGDNAWFARNLVNRAWAHFMGRGLVVPVDDVRLTNPPSNPELLDALARHLVDKKYDYHELIRTITASQTYQRSSRPNKTNERDEQNYSRFLMKRMDAEVLLDAVCQTTGIGEKFHGVPAGSRAIQLWDSQVPHYFLKLFGRPFRTSACECERVTEPTVGQVLHVMNSPKIHEKLSHAAGNIAKLVRDFSDNDYVVDDLYLNFFSRLPNDDERKIARTYLEGSKDRRQAAEDLAWSMMNSSEFLFNH